MEHFTSPLDCIKKLQDNFNEVTPEITQIFLSESIVANRKKVEDIVMSFDKYAEYFASLKDESIKIGGLHICKGISFWFGNKLFHKPDLVGLIIKTKGNDIGGLLSYIIKNSPN